MLLLAVTTTACNVDETEPTVLDGVQTRLLVKPPETALPVGSPLTVRSITEALTPGVSHVELYAVQLPPLPPDEELENLSGDVDPTRNVLIRSDAAPFDQTTFTAAQDFTPLRPGHYVIKVVGYNRLGQSAESEYISFTVE